MKKITKESINRAIAFVLGVVLLLNCVGCSVDSEKNIINYAEEKYGNNHHIKTVTQADEIMCYFTDDEYGFEYYVSSYLNEIIVDGSSFGTTENKGSNFDIQYYNYLCNALLADFHDLETNYNVTIEISDGKYSLAQVHYKTTDTSDVANITKEISDLYAALDTRHYFEDIIVEAYDFRGEYLGAYHYKQSEWMTPEDEIKLEFIMHIHDLCPQAVYLRTERHRVADTGVDINDVVGSYTYPDITETTTVNCYIFSVDGKEFFMADFLYRNENGLERYYTNYK